MVRWMQKNAHEQGSSIREQRIDKRKRLLCRRMRHRFFRDGGGASFRKVRYIGTFGTVFLLFATIRPVFAFLLWRCVFPLHEHHRWNPRVCTSRQAEYLMRVADHNKRIHVHVYTHTFTDIVTKKAHLGFEIVPEHYFSDFKGIT